MRALHLPLEACLVFVLLAAGCVGGNASQASSGTQAPPTVAAAGDSADGGTIDGVVVDDSQTPIEGAVALAKEANLTAQSDAAGHFAFVNLAAGTYNVYVARLGYESVVKRVTVGAGETTSATFTLSAIPIATAYSDTQIKALEILFGVSWAIAGDFDQGCIEPGVTCQGAAVSTLQPLNGPNSNFTIDDPKVSPVATIIMEQTWVPNSAICAKAVQVGIYNPKAPSTANPSSKNPHYWTNYPHPTFKITSPIWMRIPRYEAANMDAIDNETRIEENKGDKLLVRGLWTVRDFPPGKGLTNLPADGNCFTQQKINLFWSTFFLEPAPPNYTARPDA